MSLLDELKFLEKDDRYLYHYTKYSTAIEYIFNDNTLLFNTLKKMNDPLEFQDFINCISWCNDISKDERDRLLSDSNEINKTVKMKFKICCFCIDADRSYIPMFHKGYCRSRMWSQYSDSHTGVCIIFNKRKLLEILTKSHECVFEHEILYNNSLPGLYNACNIEREEYKGPIEWILKHKIAYFFSKLEDYKDENEYRIVLYSEKCQNEDNIAVNLEDSMEGVILGAKFPDVYKINIQNVLSKKGTPLLKINWYNGQPELYQIKNGLSEDEIKTVEGNI